MSIIIAVLVFGIIVLIHELGHFAAARKSGITVEEFALGMGPKIWSYQKGETLYSLRLFPLGGSCRMLGDEDGSQDEGSFNSKPVWKRIIVIFAGVFMNILLALLILTALVMVTGYRVPVIREVMPDYPAQEAGLLPGDKIVKVNGSNIHIYEDLSYTVNAAEGTPIQVVVERDGERIDKLITPKLHTTEDGTQSYLIGFTADVKSGVFSERVDGFSRAGFFDSLETGFFQNIFYVKITLQGLVQLVTLKISVDQMSGPIGVVSMVGEVYTESIESSVWLAVQNILRFTALISANLAVFNLLPLPALDGGRLVFLLIEAVRRKPVKAETEGMIHFVGFVLLMIFAVFVAFNDVMKLL